jgi:hypothetical protein
MLGFHEVATAHEEKEMLHHYENDGISIITQIEIEI